MVRCCYGKIQHMRQRIVFRSSSVMVFLLLVFSVILSFFGYSAFTDAVAEKRADGRRRVCKGCGAVRRADHDVYEIQKTAATVSCAMDNERIIFIRQ